MLRVHPDARAQGRSQLVVSCDLLRGTPRAFDRTLPTQPKGLLRVSQVILTAVGYLLLLLSGLAVCLFCWLSYASLTNAARPQEPPAQDKFLEHAAHGIRGPIGAGG